MEAGNRCFDQNVPEEINRKIVDHVSDVNLPYTEHSRRYLLDEGFNKANIFVTGSPMTEVIEAHRDKINQSDVLNKLGLEPQQYILVSAHREENIDNEDNFNSLMNAINDIAKNIKCLLFIRHIQEVGKIEESQFEFDPLVRQLKPFGFF